MTKDREEKSQGRDYAKRPRHQVAGRRDAKHKQLHWVLAHIRCNHQDAERKHDEPAIVDAHGNAVNARNENLAFEKRFEIHERGKVKGKGPGARTEVFDASERFSVPSAILVRAAAPLGLALCS